jgi:hypothetical protein
VDPLPNGQAQHAPARSEPAVDDRRRAERVPVQLALSLRCSSAPVAGTSENISEVGVLLRSSADLRLEVEWTDEHGQPQRRSGRLVRVQRLDAAQLGIAIEFDPR